MPKKQRKLSAEFFDSEATRVYAIAQDSVQESATKLRQKTLAEIRRNFRQGPNSAGFFGAVKQYDLPAQGKLGPASYVVVGVPFMRAFQEGAKISGKPNVIILLPDGERLRMPRINKTNPWSKVYQRFGSNFFVSQVSDGAVVIYRNPRDGRNYPVYKIQKSVQAPKKLSFFEMAEEIAGVRDGGS